MPTVSTSALKTWWKFTFRSATVKNMSSCWIWWQQQKVGKVRNCMYKQNHVPHCEHVIIYMRSSARRDEADNCELQQRCIKGSVHGSGTLPETSVCLQVKAASHREEATCGHDGETAPVYTLMLMMRMETWTCPTFRDVLMASHSKWAQIFIDMLHFFYSLCFVLNKIWIHEICTLIEPPSLYVGRSLLYIIVNY